jgi:nucleotide-binding universal stress UspA family protein
VPDPTDEAAGPPRAVVGVGESTAGEVALGWALDLCRTRGWRLDVVTAWPDLGEPAVHDVPGHYSVPRGRAVVAQEAALRACRVDPADPAVRTYVVNADPVDALVERSEGARLLVVGATGRGRSHRRGHPSIGESCGTRAGCPVVVVGGSSGDPGDPGDPGDTERSGQPIVTAGSR